MIAFRVEPAAPPPGPSRAAPAAGAALGLKGQAQPEPHQGRVLPVKEGEAVLRRGDGEPHASPKASAVLHPSPVLGGGDPAEPLPPFPIHRQGKNPLLLTEAPRLGARDLPVHGVGLGPRGQGPPLLHSGAYRHHRWGVGCVRPKDRCSSHQALDVRKNLRPGPKVGGWGDLLHRAEPRAPPTERKPHLQVDRLRPARSGPPEDRRHVAHHGVKLRRQVF